MQPESFTPFQRLGIVKEVTGIKVITRPYEYCVAVRVTDELVTATFAGVTVVWRERSHRITHTTLKIRAWRRTAAAWAEVDGIHVATPLDEPLLITHGQVYDPDGREDRIAWEQLAWRCGNSRWPVDSYARTLQGYNRG